VFANNRSGQNTMRRHNYTSKYGKLACARFFNSSTRDRMHGCDDFADRGMFNIDSTLEQVLSRLALCGQSSMRSSTMNCNLYGLA
jgi:hypothetical protein